MSIAPRLPRLLPCPTCGAPPGDVSMTDAPSTVRTLPRYVEEHPKCSSCEHTEAEEGETYCSMTACFLHDVTIHYCRYHSSLVQP